MDAVPKMKKLLWFRFSPDTWDRDKKAKALEMYDKGMITRMEYRAIMLEWSTDASGRKFHYQCPKCGKPMRHCPDPSCAEDGVGHHLFEEDWEGCDEDIPYATATRVYFPVVVSPGNVPGGTTVMESVVIEMSMIDQIKAELNEAIQKVLAKYSTDDYPEGCEFHGELRGLLQQKGHPETANGWHFQIGKGLPEGWQK